MSHHPEYRCEGCGKLVSILNETDDLVWLCNDCYEKYQEYEDPDCMLDDDLTLE